MPRAKLCVIECWADYCDTFVKLLMCSSVLLVGTGLTLPDDWSLLIGLVGPVNDSLCTFPRTFIVSAVCSGAKV